MNNSLKSSRNESIDSVAGLMIIYMVFTHVMQGFGQTHVECYKILERVLYFFMPWFFFKAGMFFKINDNRTFVKKSAKRLLMPFLIYSLIGHLVYLFFILSHDKAFSFFTLIPIDALLRYGSIEGNLPLWFLLTLFVCRVLMNYVMNIGIKPITISFISLLAACLLHYFGITYPFYISNCMTGLFFMGLGKTCMSYKEVDSTAFIIIAIIIYCFSFVYPSIVDMHSNKLYCGSYILWFLYSFSGIIAINRIAKYGFLDKIRLNIIGRYSMEIYCSHWIILMFLQVIL